MRTGSTRVLVTGSRGLVGAAVGRALEQTGHEVVAFDLLDGRDILDAGAIREAARGCDAVVHAAAALGAPGETPEAIMATNVQGTWNVLIAARDAGVRRIVFLSSVDALGVFKGERAPTYLPLDDAHPCHPTTPYGISKHLGEEMCRLFSDAHDLPIIALRPPGVWTEKTYGRIQAARAERASFEWSPFWEFGAFVDLRDLSSACVAALSHDIEGFHRLLVASSDLTTSGRTSRELARFVHPDVAWCGGAAYDDDPYRTLVDIEPARRLLGWRPRHTWRGFIEGECPEEAPGESRA